MKERILSRRPSPALVISIIALCTALGGSAYAAKKIGTKSLKNNAVTAKKVKNAAITEAKLANEAVTDSKLGKVVSRSNSVDVPDNSAAGLTVLCQAGEKLVGGGARFVNSGASKDLLLISSGPVESSTSNNGPPNGAVPGGWRGAGSNLTGDTGTFPLTVFALCLQ